MMRVWRLFVCLSVAYIGPKSRTERPRKTTIGTDVAHVTRDSDTAFEVKRSKVTLQGRGHIVAASRTACLTLKWYLRSPFIVIFTVQAPYTITAFALTGQTYNGCCDCLRDQYGDGVIAPASDQAYEHVRRHRQQQLLLHANKKTAKHVDNARRYDDRIQARTGDVISAGSSGGPGRPDLVVMLSCVSLLTAAAAAARTQWHLATTLT